MVNGNFCHDNNTFKDKPSVIDMFSLKGKTADVTGVGAAIWLSVAYSLAEAGANVAIWYYSNKKRIEEAAIIEKIYGVQCRLSIIPISSGNINRLLFQVAHTL